jgi:homeobox-leucine zipper protein
MEENDRLQKQVSHLVYENGYMKQQIHTVSVRHYSFSLFFCF